MIYSWQEPYLRVLLETDSSKRHGKVLEARSSLEQRLLSPTGDEELHAMLIAASKLDAIERGPSDIVERITAMRQPAKSPPTNENRCTRARGLESGELATQSTPKRSFELDAVFQVLLSENAR